MTTRIRILTRLFLIPALLSPVFAGPAAAQPGATRIVFDQAHVQSPPAPAFLTYAAKRGYSVLLGSTPIESATLDGARLLYLRAPTTAISDAEVAAIVRFVKGGGSLLVILDEEERQGLAATRVNTLLAAFDMRLTADTPYRHNTGGLAKVGEINRADREIPYSGGRAVEGGTPFAWQLDEEGRLGFPFAAWTRAGGRVVVMGEAMASLYLGTPDGVRLSGDRTPGGTTVYWGKDSTPFMDEVLQWLLAAPAGSE